MTLVILQQELVVLVILHQDLVVLVILHQDLMVLVILQQDIGFYRFCICSKTWWFCFLYVVEPVGFGVWGY